MTAVCSIIFRFLGLVSMNIGQEIRKHRNFPPLLDPNVGNNLAMITRYFPRCNIELSNSFEQMGSDFKEELNKFSDSTQNQPHEPRAQLLALQWKSSALVNQLQ